LPGAAEVTKADWIEVRKLRRPDLLAPSQSENALGHRRTEHARPSKGDCRGCSLPGPPEGPKAGNRVRLCGARHRRPAGIVLSARRYRRPSSSVRSVDREWRLHPFGATELSPRSPRAATSIGSNGIAAIRHRQLLAYSGLACGTPSAAAAPDEAGPPSELSRPSCHRHQRCCSGAPWSRFDDP
jgi:hypothetical protein